MGLGDPYVISRAGVQAVAIAILINRGGLVAVHRPSPVRLGLAGAAYSHHIQPGPAMMVPGVELSIEHLS